MPKKFVVRLAVHEREELQSVVKKLKGTGQKVRRAQILLKADAEGPNWTDERIAEAFLCRTRTVEKIRQRLVERGFDEVLHRVERSRPWRRCCRARRRPASSRRDSDRRMDEQPVPLLKETCADSRHRQACQAGRLRVRTSRHGHQLHVRRTAGRLA